VRSVGIGRRQHVAREQLDRGQILLIQHLQQHALHARLVPLAQALDDLGRRAHQEARGAPARFVGGHLGEDGAGRRDALGHVGAVAADGERDHQGAGDGLGIAADGGAVRGQHLALLPEAGPIHPRDVPLVRELGRDAERALLAPAADHHAQAAVGGQGMGLGLPQWIVGLLEGDRLADAEGADVAGRALQPVEPLLHGRERDAEHVVLVLVPAPAEPEVDAPVGERVERSRHLGEQRGVVERDRRDHRAEADAPGAHRHRGERRPRLERGTSRVAEEPGEMVRSTERLVAHVLGGLHQPEPPLPGEPFLPFDHDADAHDVAPSGARCREIPIGTRVLMYTASAAFPAVINSAPSRPWRPLSDSCC
jgi:hypothetical protein